MSELENLKAENAKLEERIAKLEEAAKPAEPFVSNWPGPRDYTQGFSMPREAMQRMIDAVPDRLMNELRSDALKPNPMTLSGGVTKPTATEPPKVIGKKGWIDERKLEPPPRIDLMDQMMDAQDAQDRTELARKIAQARLAEEK